MDATERRLREHDNHRRMAAMSVPTLRPFISAIDVVGHLERAKI